MKIINKYILKETLGPLLLSLFVVTFVFLLMHILRIADLVINKGMSLWVLLEIMGNMALFLFQFTLPISFITAVLLGLGRLSSDNEILAMRSLGVSIHRIVVPVLLLSLALSFLLLFMQDRVFPALKERENKIFHKLTSQSQKFILKEKEIIEGLGEYKFVINKVSGDRIENIIAYVPVGNNTIRVITAKKGIFKMLTEENAIKFDLFYGTIDEPRAPETRSFYKMIFEDYKLTIPLRDFSQGPSVRSMQAMGFSELLKSAKLVRKSGNSADERPFLNEFYKRITFSFSAFILTLLSISLSVSLHRSEKSINFAMAIVLVVLYYTLLGFGEAMTLKGIFIPLVTTSLPNIVLGTLGIILYVRLVKS